ncbi:hypothetical protein CC85DRAFT_305223 [Cutaneotrichosporon oleaginosum]|uniref:DUF938-domain-containing protein n=1 Tax=Cutaneotrichosporon oleaginosum TaxID=879819 RepID=A0A0J0XDQ7_9TREE|nr:uncharacterized protein CC85DRAFT_305223 [Cutaneotrichosporon oleaginosum]KLT39202.1 hypothetical protein CC85DRAFT_305223 [Cutaneotrichosporon oleaginosum]TXT05695.1 hypothetical protein COLE_07015 [Cutaneotrichosporon oleaginosum]
MTITYPSVISVPGSAQRNIGTVIECLEPLVNGPVPAKYVLELASFPYQHIRGYAAQWPHVHFSGTVRDADELEKTPMEGIPGNIAPPEKLDIAIQEDWDALFKTVNEPFDGVIMVNLVHCTPEGLPEHVFRNLSPLTPEGRRVLAPGAWIGVYGAYLNDDGSFRSDGDAKFDAEYIKGVHPSLGLRTPKSLRAMAEKWGWREESQSVVAKGNLFIVFRATIPN